MAKLKRLRDIELAKLDVQDAAAKTFLQDLDLALRRLNTRVQRYLVDFEGAERLATTGRNLARAVNAQAEIEEMLLESGYRRSTDRLLESYDRVAAMTQDGLRAAGIDARFTATDARALEALKQLDLSRWEAVGGDLVRAIHGSMMDAVVGGATVRELERAIELQLVDEPPVAGRAKTLANTLTQSFDRAVTNRKAKAAGISTFVYLGPDDEVTRPFCQAVLSGEGAAEFNVPAVDGDPPVYTDEQISAMDNGQGLPVFQMGGGYNCRHKFRPISVKVAEEALTA
jgi:hypothetical protein